MQLSERELTDIEMIDAFLDILDMAVSNSNDPIREEFKKTSRCDQLGYDLKRYLLEHKFVRLGDKYHQEVLDINEHKTEKEKM